MTSFRNLLVQTRWLLRCGRSRHRAIETITRVNASVLGVDDHIGVLSRGRWASLTGWTGDPFCLEGYPQAVFGEGRVLYKVDRHRRAEESGAEFPGFDGGFLNPVGIESPGPVAVELGEGARRIWWR